MMSNGMPLVFTPLTTTELPLPVTPASGLPPVLVAPPVAAMLDPPAPPSPVVVPDPALPPVVVVADPPPPPVPLEPVLLLHPVATAKRATVTTIPSFLMYSPFDWK